MPIDVEGHTDHISQQFNNELNEIKTHLMEMGGLVEQQVENAVYAIIEADSGKADQVLDRDHTINAMEISIDEECARILARRQPAASDLRLVISVTKAITDLERIGDEAKKIAHQAIALTEDGVAPKGYVEIRHIGEQVSNMVHNSLDAFARLDIDQALTVVKADKNVDVEYATAMRAMVTFMMEDPRSISRVLNIMWSLRSLERIGDHARNIAQYVIYLVKGKDVRHTGLKEMVERFKES